MNTCAGCGKPLDSRPSVCPACRSARADSPLDEDAGEARDRLERFFIVSSFRCANCGDIHGTVTKGGTVYQASDFGIDSVEEWELEMDKEQTWIEENRTAVDPALPALTADWPESVAALQTVLR